MRDIFDDDVSLPSKDRRLGILLWFYLSGFFNHSIRVSNQHLKEWNLSAAQFDVLVQVGATERLTQKELGNRLLVTKGNITQLLTKMEKMELIKREREWKTNYLSLTKKGNELYREVVPKQEAFQAAQFRNLNREEPLLLLDLLKKLRQHSHKEEET